MLIVYSEKHRLHAPELYFAMGRMSAYPEQPSRVDSILNALNVRQFGDIIEPLDFGMAPIAAVHSCAYIEYVKRAYKEWLEKDGDPNGVIPDTYGVNLSAKSRDIVLQVDNVLAVMGLFTFDSATVISSGTFDAAYEACQVALTAAKSLVDNQLMGAYALCRPPGHHSAEELLGGFCFFNNGAIATKYLIEHYDKKVCVLDIDYHHGNGTQLIFYNRANPLTISIHGKNSDPYFWGSAKETGKGEGEGFNKNIELPDGTGDNEYLKTLRNVIDDTVLPYQPDIVVVSLGVDTFIDDPVGSFNITSACFYKIGQVIASMNLPCLFIQEGGYDSPELGINVVNVLQGFEESVIVH
jgi:acetoin utilization deacetylase AcuC-like enzyme